MSNKQALKRAMARYAKEHGIDLPAGFVPRSDSFGVAAKDLLIAIQKRSGQKADGICGPYTLMILGQYFMGDVGARAARCMEMLEGPIETGGNNLGSTVQAIQKLGVTELRPGNWPYCAATVSWALRCAGWIHWESFIKSMSEAWVESWVIAAKSGKFGLSIVDWRRANRGDAIAFQFDADPERDHVGMLRARPSQSSGLVNTVEGNTGPGDSGPQGDGDGLWTRTRPAGSPNIIIRIS